MYVREHAFLRIKLEYLWTCWNYMTVQQVVSFLVLSGHLQRIHFCRVLLVMTMYIEPNYQHGDRGFHPMY